MLIVLVQHQFAKLSQINVRHVLLVWNAQDILLLSVILEPELVLNAKAMQIVVEEKFVRLQQINVLNA